MLQSFYRVDLDRRRMMTLVNEPLASGEVVWFRGDKFALCLEFVRRNSSGQWTAWNIAATASLFAILKDGDDRAAATPLAWTSATDVDVAGVWEDAAAGTEKHSFKIDLTSAALLALFGTAVPSETLVFEVSMIDVDGNPSTLFQQEVTIVGDLYRGNEGTPTPAEPTYYDASTIDAMLAARLRLAAGKRVVVDGDNNLSAEDVP